jgi:phosphonate transport system ATP-binding protein
MREEAAVLSEAVVEVREVSKTFDRRHPVLRNVSFSLDRGEMVALIGSSGSGKSTLIRAVAGLVPIDKSAGSDGSGAAAGEIILFGQLMQRRGRISPTAKNLRVRVGVVFQQFNLVPRLSVLTNVCLGLLGQMSFFHGIVGRFTAADKHRAMQALTRVGIADHALKRGANLSGGQQQRAAIARTLVQGAELLIADEPIASLDPGSARRVMDILADLNRRDRITMLVSLHQVEYALRYCPRTIALRSGEVVYDGPSSELTPALLTSIYGADNDDFVLERDGVIHAPTALPTVPGLALAGLAPHAASQGAASLAEHVRAIGEADRLRA